MARATVAMTQEVARGWGSAALARRLPLPPRIPRPLRAVGRWMWTAAPVLVVALALALMAVAYARKQGYTHGLGVAGFLHIGRTFGERIGLESMAVGPTGYDGQFYYFIARDPGVIATCAAHSGACPLDDLYLVRAERILFPLVARAVALGQVGLLPYAFLAVNVVAILATTVLVGRMCRDAGASRWLGAAAGLYCGQDLAFLRDLADPFALLWVVVAVYLARREHWSWAGVAVACALLTRESLIFSLPLLALPLLAQRRWTTLARSAALALVPFAAWQGVLFALFGQLPLLHGDSGAAKLVPVPFFGLWQVKWGADFGLIVVSTAIPLVLAAVIALRALWHDGPASLLRDPLPAMVLLYALLLSMTYYFQWMDMWAPPRLAAPAVVLALLVLPRLRAPNLAPAYASLLAVSALFPLSVVIR